jgi:hypothetical protein
MPRWQICKKRNKHASPRKRALFRKAKRDEQSVFMAPRQAAFSAAQRENVRERVQTLFAGRCRRKKRTI